MKLTNNERELVVVMVILGVIGFFYVRGIHQEIARAEKIDEAIALEEAAVQPFLDIALASHAFSIYDTKNQKFIYKVNAEKVMPLASLAKVMSAILVLERVPADYVFTIDKSSLSQTGDNGLLVGERWGRDELLKFTLVASSNDAIHDIATETGALIDPLTTDPISVFVDAMNAKARELNLPTMMFYNESGLDIEDSDPVKNGAYANARDMAKLFAYAVTTYPDIFSATAEKEYGTNSYDAPHIAINTNPLVADIPGLIASKTGFTDISGGNLVVSVPDTEGRMIVVTVLGSTFDERFTDIQTLSGALQNHP